MEIKNKNVVFKALNWNKNRIVVDDNHNNFELEFDFNHVEIQARFVAIIRYYFSDSHEGGHGGHEMLLRKNRLKRQTRW